MPVFEIPTADGDTVTWYDGCGCIAFRGALYFVGDSFNDCRAHMIRAVIRGMIGEATIWGPVPVWPAVDPSWPQADFCIIFHFDPLPGMPYHAASCFFMRERAAFKWERLKFVDEINPAFHRLQRWLRSRLRARRIERRLAFAMGSHARLGDASPVAVLVPDAVRAVMGFV